VVSNASVELTRQEAADVETTLLACHRAAPTLAVPDDRLAILVRHVEHGIVGNWRADSLCLCLARSRNYPMLQKSFCTQDQKF